MSAADEKLRKLCEGSVEWRVSSPAGDSYCMVFSDQNSRHPERDARDWLANHVREFPNSPHAGYEVRSEVCTTELQDAALAQLADMGKVQETCKMLSQIVHNMVAANQAAWIEWQHGKGAEAAMTWVHNGLWGPGQIPDEDSPYGKEAQAFYDANCADPLPTCKCGRPSNQIWMGQGFCSVAHYHEARSQQEQTTAQEPGGTG